MVKLMKKRANSLTPKILYMEDNKMVHNNDDDEDVNLCLLIPH